MRPNKAALEITSLLKEFDLEPAEPEYGDDVPELMKPEPRALRIILMPAFTPSTRVILPGTPHFATSIDWERTGVMESTINHLGERLAGYPPEYLAELTALTKTPSQEYTGGWPGGYVKLLTPSCMTPRQKKGCRR